MRTVIHCAFWCPKNYISFILKDWWEHSHRSKHHSVWLLHWRQWQRKRANVLGGGEGGRTASARTGNQAGTSATAAEHLPDPHLPCPRRSILHAHHQLRFHCRLKCPEASASHHLPPLTFSVAGFLSSAAWDCPSGPSLIYPCFLNI